MADNSDIIDPEEVFLGENNEPLTGEQFGGNPTPAGNPNPDPNEEEEEEEKPSIPDNNEPAPAEPGQEEPDPLEGANPAEYAMKWLGYQTDEVDFGDGVKVKLNELTPEQQTDVLFNQLQTVVETYETELQNLRTGTPQLENDLQKNVWEFLKNNGDPKELAKYILENDPQNMVTGLSSEDLVRKHLTEVMGMEGDELESEVAFLKENERLDSYSARAKKYFESKGTDLSGLTEAQRNKIQESETLSLQEYEEEKTKTINYTSTVKELSGIPVDDTVKQFITQQITPPSHKDDSEFIKQLNSPEKLFRLAFLDNYFEDIIDNVKSTYFEMGKGSIKSPAEDLSKNPIQVRSFRTKSATQRPAAVTKDGKVDFDKLLNSNAEI